MVRRFHSSLPIKANINFPPKKSPNRSIPGRLAVISNENMACKLHFGLHIAVTPDLSLGLRVRLVVMRAFDPPLGGVSILT